MAAPPLFSSLVPHQSYENIWYEAKMRLYAAARHAATVFDELNRLIENSLLARKEKPPIKD